MTARILVLTRRDIERLITVRTAIRVVHDAFKSLTRRQAAMPPKVYLPLPGGNDFRAMPAYLAHPPACGVKWVNVHPRNPQRGLPTVMAVIVTNDPATGVPVAVMDGLLITKLRTAAAAAVAAQTLARPRSRVVGLVGCGAQADAQLLALAELFALERVQVWGYGAGEARAFCRRFRSQLPRAALVPCASVEVCARNVDVLVTVTPSRRPLVKRAWVAPGTHINAIGADAPGKQELDSAILREALVIVDDREQSVHAGELNVPIRRGRYRPAAIHATLGEVLVGRRRGRRFDEEITLFDSTGLAVHDVAMAAEIVRQARRHGIGRQVDLMGS